MQCCKQHVVHFSKFWDCEGFVVKPLDIKKALNTINCNHNLCKKFFKEWFALFLFATILDSLCFKESGRSLQKEGEKLWNNWCNGDLRQFHTPSRHCTYRWPTPNFHWQFSLRERERERKKLSLFFLRKNTVFFGDLNSEQKSVRFNHSTTTTMTKILVLLLCCCLFALSSTTPVDSGKYLAHQETDYNQEVLETSNEQERQDFIRLLNMILWDEDPEEENGRQYHPHRLFGWRGLLGQPMPQLLKKQGTVANTIYDEFANTCYSFACVLGINRLASQLGRIMG